MKTAIEIPEVIAQWEALLPTLSHLRSEQEVLARRAWDSRRFGSWLSARALVAWARVEVRFGTYIVATLPRFYKPLSKDGGDASSRPAV